MDCRGCRLWIEPGQSLAADGAFDAGFDAIGLSRLEDNISKIAAAFGCFPVERGPALCVDGLAVESGPPDQFLRPYRYLERLLDLFQPAGLYRSGYQLQRGMERPVRVHAMAWQRIFVAIDFAGICTRRIWPDRSVFAAADRKTGFGIAGIFGQ